MRQQKNDGIKGIPFEPLWINIFAKIALDFGATTTICSAVQDVWLIVITDGHPKHSSNTMDPCCLWPSVPTFLLLPVLFRRHRDLCRAIWSTVKSISG